MFLCGSSLLVVERTTISPTPHQLRALTHPVRLRMLGLLRTEGPATATSLAERLGLNSGATSYHLRQLAAHGFVVDDAGRGNGRERWWRAAHTTTRTVTPPAHDLGAQDTSDAYLQTVATIYTERLQRAVEERSLLPAAWREATTFSDYPAQLTPRRARALLERLDELLSNLPEEEDDDDAAPYTVMLMAFPRPGSLTVDPMTLGLDGVEPS